MWIVLPTKDCKCASCEKLRELVDEGGQLNMGRPDGLAHNPARSQPVHLSADDLWALSHRSG